MIEYVGPYRLLRSISKGAMGETFVAERTESAGVVQRVCLKRMLDESRGDPKWIHMFQNEARLVGAIRHPNVAQLHGFGEADGAWWMALELVEGVDLRALLSSLRASGQRLPLEVVVFVAYEIAKALAHAHELRLPAAPAEGIIHRDVSPSNILLSVHGAVKLTDFGIAKVRSLDGTRTANIKGKAPYMSPEQASGDALDGRADLFALGVVLHEMIAGARPYDGESHLHAAMNAIAGKRTVDVRAAAPETPEPLLAIVDRLIAPRREHRLATASEVLDALDTLGVTLRASRWLAHLVRARRLSAAGSTDRAAGTSR